MSYIWGDVLYNIVKCTECTESLYSRNQQGAIYRCAFIYGQLCLIFYAKLGLRVDHPTDIGNLLRVYQSNQVRSNETKRR